MKIAVTANGTDLDAPTSPVFGRCPTYVLVDTETMEYEAIANPAIASGGGAGIQAAQFIVARGAEAIVTGNVGPNALGVFEAAGTSVYLTKEGTVRQALTAYKDGLLSPAAGATVPAHTGMGQGEQRMTRIAVSVGEDNGLDSAISAHFGRCPYFVLVDMEEGEIKAVDTVPNPYFGHHQPGQVPGFIHSQGADVMLAAGMGGRAITFFEEYGIHAATGARGTVRNALEQYFGQQLQGAEPCSESHEHGH